jgi:hypothetical protein
MIPKKYQYIECSALLEKEGGLYNVFKKAVNIIMRK